MKWLERAVWSRTAVALLWAINLAALTAMFVVDSALSKGGRADLTDSNSAGAVAWIVAITAAGIVGTVLALRRPENAAGWLFLLLTTSISLSGFTASYGAYGMVYRPGSLPGAWLAAAYADGAFLPWISLLGLILLVTPTGAAPSRRWKAVGWAAGISGVVFVAAIPFRSSAIDSSPFIGLKSPYANAPFAPAVTVVAFVMLVTAHIALLAAVVSLVYRARRASPEERQQLRWLLVPAIPFPFLVAGAWVAAAANKEAILSALGLGYLVIIPVAALLAIEKQRLYDVDRIISRTVAYTLLSALVVAGYVAIVLAVGIAGGSAASRSVPVAVVATLAAIALGGLTRNRLQDAVDRRFNRRAFTALEQVRRYVRAPLPGVTIEQALRNATGDPDLSVSYWSEARSAWVTEDGSPASLLTGAFEMQTATGDPGAAISFDTGISDGSLIESLATEARPEIENARLRAAISLQLVEVRESRARIVSAQVAERKRIERDLHDGSQQRLLALAMNLRATEMAGDANAAMKALPGAIEQIQTTVRELRELANGLHPGVLEDGGLSAAFQELAARAPIPIRLKVVDTRLPASVESSAWFIACEAIANVVKHARASTVSLFAEVADGMLVLAIEDNGVGGANANGHGLRGMADRAEAAGGSLSIGELSGGGTSVRAVLPCES